MSTERPDVDAKRSPPRMRRVCPVVCASVHANDSCDSCFLARVLVTASTMLVAERDRRVVVAGHAGIARSTSSATVSFGHGPYPTRSPM
jgi:hypothetical protein